MYEAALTVTGFAPAERRKSVALAQERAELAARGFAASAERKPFPVPATLSAAVGCCYVLEGSTLGGMQIAMRVRERLDWTSRFYGIYGASTAAMWRAFAAAVNGLGDGLDSEAMIEAAASTFDTYGARIAGFPAQP